MYDEILSGIIINVIVNVIFMIIAVIKKIMGNIRWKKIYRKRKKAYYNILLVFVILILSFIFSFITSLFILLICYNSKSNVSAMILGLIFSIVFGFLNFALINKINYFKKELIFIKNSKLFIVLYALILNAMSSMMMIFNGKSLWGIKAVLVITMSIVEIVLLYICDITSKENIVICDIPYTLYKYSNVSVFLSDGVEIKCYDLRKMRFKGGMLIIDQEGEMITIDKKNVLYCKFGGNALYDI